MSPVLFMTNFQEDVSKVHSCKVAPSLACVFWVVGEESRGAVVEWGEQEVVRHLATLQGEVGGAHYYLHTSPHLHEGVQCDEYRWLWQPCCRPAG